MRALLTVYSCWWVVKFRQQLLRSGRKRLWHHLHRRLGETRSDVDMVRRETRPARLQPNQRRLVELCMINEKPSTAFLSSQPLNYLYWAHIRGVNFLTEIWVLVGDLDITKSIFARPKFFISVFLARVNCEKLTTRKYFTLLFSMLILKLKPLNLKHP